MGEHWIKFEPKTFGKPKVLAIKRALKMDVDAVVGKLLRVWCWADEHSVDGTNVPLHRDDIDEMCKKRGFAAAMETVGWLSGNDGSVTFPEFWKHNGTTAKSRCVTAKRVDKHRSGNGAVTVPALQDDEPCNGASVTGPLPDKKEIRLDIPSPPVGALREADVNAWAERIVAAYGLKDAPMKCLEYVATLLRRGKDDPAQVLAAVERCTATIRAKAPQGFGSAHVPRAESFFVDEQWRSPEMFEGRWTDRKPTSRHAQGPRTAYSVGKAIDELSMEEIMGAKGKQS